MNKILICSLSDRDYFSAPMFQRFKSYCKKWNYKCVLETKSLDTNRAPPWSKILLLKREMKLNPDIPFIVWIDDDIIITNHEIELLKIIEEYMEDNNIILSEEVVPPFNTGFIICRNNQDTYDYLDRIYKLGENSEYKTKPNWEQEIMINDYNVNKDKIKIIPYGIIQNFYRDYNLPAGMKWKKGDFTAHLTGMSIDRRMSIRDYILKILN